MMTLLTKVNVYDDGATTLDDGHGAVVSCNESGGLETRPAGTRGPWEVCTVQGAVVIYQPIPTARYVFSLV